MGGLHVDLEFPQGTDKSVHAFLKNAYFKWNVQKKSCKTTAKKCTNKVCCTCKVAFWLIWPIVVFHRSPALPSLLSITRFYIFLEQTVDYYRDLRVLALVKSIYIINILIQYCLNIKWFCLREYRLASVGLCVVYTSRRGYPPEDGAHIALRE